MSICMYFVAKVSSHISCIFNSVTSFDSCATINISIVFSLFNLEIKWKKKKKITDKAIHCCSALSVYIFLLNTNTSSIFNRKYVFGRHLVIVYY